MMWQCSVARAYSPLVTSTSGDPVYLRRLRDITLGKAPKLSADAIKQHYVPRFLLARLATPQNRGGP